MLKGLATSAHIDATEWASGHQRRRGAEEGALGSSSHMGPQVLRGAWAILEWETFHLSFNSYRNALSWDENTTSPYLWNPNSDSCFGKDMLLIIRGILKIKGFVIWTGSSINSDLVVLEAAHGPWKHRWGEASEYHPLRQLHRVPWITGQMSSFRFVFSSEQSLVMYVDECVLCVYSFFLSLLNPRSC